MRLETSLTSKFKDLELIFNHARKNLKPFSIICLFSVANVGRTLAKMILSTSLVVQRINSAVFFVF